MVLGLTLILGTIGISCAVLCFGFKIPPPTHNGFKDHGVRKYR